MTRSDFRGFLPPLKNPLALCPLSWYFVATFTCLIEYFVKVKPMSTLAKRLKSVTPPANVLIGRRSSPRPTASGIPRFRLFFSTRLACLAVLLAALWVVGGGAILEPRVALTQSSDGLIAFSSDRDGNGEIYAMNADGFSVTRLTNDPADDWLPSWRPASVEPGFPWSWEIVIGAGISAILASLAVVIIRRSRGK